VANLAILLAALTVWISAGPVSEMLGKSLKVTNFEGREIPTGLGLAVYVGLSMGILSGIILGGFTYQQGLVMLLWGTLVVLAGLLDDAVGDHSTRGFRGHFRALFQGSLTTGMVKALLIALGALYVSWPWTWFSPLDWLLLLLAVNFFNQLDLRPGRTLKVFLATVLLIYLLTGGPGSLLAGIGLGAAAGVLGGDLKGRWMLGDTGANLVGALTGLSLIMVLPWAGRIAAFLALVFLNLAGELWSLNRIIQGNLFLRVLDNWGRNRGDKQRIR
jgi:hypothetical protein